MSGLNESDGKAISDAIRILSEAGFNVEKVGKGKRYDHGVAFRLDLEAPTRSPWFMPQVEFAKDAVIEAPSVDMTGDVHQGGEIVGTIRGEEADPRD